MEANVSTSSLVSRLVLAALLAATIAGGTRLFAQTAPLTQSSPTGQLSVGGTAAVPIYAFSSIVSNQGNGPGGGGSGAPVISDITVGKLPDAQSTSLFTATVRGLHIPNVRIEVNQNGKAAATYELSDVIVTSFATSSTGELVSFTFARITLTVAGQSFCWDKATNSTC
jgi:hypothetical protein